MHPHNTQTSTVESGLDLSAGRVQPSIVPLFTSENAATLGRKGAEARWRKPDPPASPPPIAEPIADEADSYLAKRLARTRAQIDLISDRLEKEKEAAMIDRLAAALERLSDLERVLAGRPLPGSRRPAPDRPERKPIPTAGPLGPAASPAPTPTDLAKP